MSNINRLVWSNGFTNDKRAYSNKDPYKKSCNKCKKTILLIPEANGWKPYDLNNKPHLCKKAKACRSKKIKSYRKQCKHCERDIVLKMIKGKWKVLEPNGKRHRCDKRSIDEVLDTDHLESIPK